MKDSHKSAKALMDKFRALVKAKGFTVDELFDLLRHGAMAHCPPSHSALLKWLSGDRTPTGSYLLAILDFTQTHSKRNKYSVPNSSEQKQSKKR